MQIVNFFRDIAGGPSPQASNSKTLGKGAPQRGAPSGANMDTMIGSAQSGKFICVKRPEDDQSLGASGNTSFTTDSSGLSSQGSMDVSARWRSPIFEGVSQRNLLKNMGSDLSGKIIVRDCSEEDFEVILKRPRRVQRMWYYSSNHMMINNERVRKQTDTLIRKSELDALARWHAETMAAANKVCHSNPKVLHTKVQDLSQPFERVGENVAKGASVREIHKKMMESASDVNNMLDKRYKEMGMATARGSDGDLYLCQIFRG